MKDKTRLAITGAVALVALAVTVGGTGIHINLDDDDEQQGQEAQPRTLPNLRNFDGVTLIGPDDVVVTQGADFSVRAEGDTEALDHLNIYVKDGTLQVGRKDSSSLLGNGGGAATVHITLPALTHVSLTGSGDMEIDKLSGKQVRAQITGPGNLSIADLSADAADLALTGSGDLIVGGKALTTMLSTTGSGDIDADNLAAGNASLRLVGSGDIRARASKGADISIMGTGDAQVRGTASCRVSKMGTGEAECTTS
jgi:hypothetical protein